MLFRSALDYYLAVTGESEGEFYAKMESIRHPRMRGVAIPVHKKEHKNEERILPFPEQLVGKFNKSGAKRTYIDKF